MQTLDFVTGPIRTQVAIAGWSAFPQGKASMAIMPSYTHPTFLQSMGQSFAQVKTTLIPRGKGDFTTTQYGWGFFVPKTAQHPEEAWEFLQWYALSQGSEGMTRLGVAMMRGFMPMNQVDMRARRQQLATEPFWEGFVAGWT